MQTIETFAVIGGDLRAAYLAGLLAQDGFKVITSGLDSTDLPPCVTGCTNLTQAVSLADCVVLPLPVTTDGTTLNAPFSRVRIQSEQVLGALSPSQFAVGGGVPAAWCEQAAENGVTLHDYLQREELALLNSVPTAEGAVQLAMEELPVTLRGARALVTGYGRVARALCSLLIAMGAEVTVAARRCSDRAAASVAGCSAVELAAVADAGDFDVIFNTVPALVFDAALLKKLERSTLLIDLASRPGGVDFAAAAALQMKTVWALSLPGRVAPKSAADILRQTVLNMLREEGRL
ncbi:MAG: dipicolinate synthase subunit DpsA [Ruminococcaceae bacterium]|nr:dipicolinate synthase subunit DpsA [Oscillospiraceae bacterium]